MNDLAFRAMIFAHQAHAGQRRKYTGEPYFSHLAEVAGLVASVAPPDRAQTMIAVAYGHDLIEDHGVTEPELADLFGREVARGVLLLSDLEREGNRAARKAASRRRLAGAPGWVQTIKVADLISNTASIVEHDPKFARVYLDEKRKLLAVLIDADPRLLSIAHHQTT